MEEVARCPGVQPRIAGATRAAPYRAAKEYSYRSRQVAGDGWVMIGDAWGFLDPLYSSGVLLALKSGQLAADTIAEGLAAGDQLHPLQQAFHEEHALQCGFCTPGFLMSLDAFLREHPDPTDDQIREQLSGNLCRCTGYWPIHAAGKKAARRMRGEA